MINHSDLGLAVPVPAKSWGGPEQMQPHHLIGSAPHNSPGMARAPKIPSCLRSSWAARTYLKGASRSIHEARGPISCGWESMETSVVASQCSVGWGTQHPHLSGGGLVPVKPVPLLKVGSAWGTGGAQVGVWRVGVLKLLAHWTVR